MFGIGLHSTEESISEIQILYVLKIAGYMHEGNRSTEETRPELYTLLEQLFNILNNRCLPGASLNLV